VSVLAVEEVSVSFGGRLALDGVDLRAEPGHVTGLIGPNGAGKTTLFNVICGLLPADRGRVLLDDLDLARLGPHKRARQGLARTFQRLELFAMLTVRENIQVAVETHRRWSRQREPVAPRVDELLGLLQLTDVADERVTTLSTGRGRLVELGRALACRPSVLLLDEPASGQDDHETDRFAALLRSLVADDLAVVLVEHDMRLVMQVCDLVHVLDTGRVLAVGTPAQIQADEDVLSAYLGTATTKETP
jgi:branched-chain amino acid transport system ATP-binding protein